MLTIEQLIKELFGATLDSSAIKALVQLPTATAHIADSRGLTAPMPRVTPTPKPRVTPTPKPRKYLKAYSPSQHSIRQCFANKDSYFYPQPFPQRVRRVG